MTAEGSASYLDNYLMQLFSGEMLTLRRAVVLAILFGLILPALLVGQGSPLASEAKWSPRFLMHPGTTW